MKATLYTFTIEHHDQVIVLWKESGSIGLSEAASLTLCSTDREYCHLEGLNILPTLGV
jgi:hypothetical protein